MRRILNFMFLFFLKKKKVIECCCLVDAWSVWAVCGESGLCVTSSWESDHKPCARRGTIFWVVAWNSIISDYGFGVDAERILLVSFVFLSEKTYQGEVSKPYYSTNKANTWAEKEKAVVTWNLKLNSISHKSLGVEYTGKLLLNNCVNLGCGQILQSLQWGISLVL